MRFFFNRNMSPYLARAVDALDRDNSILHHDDDPRFNKKTTDIEWLTALSKDDPRWIVLSGDVTILRNKAEQLALKESKLTYFCLTKRWAHMPIWEYAWRFIRIWPRSRRGRAELHRGRRYSRSPVVDQTRSNSSGFDLRRIFQVDS